MRTSKEEKEDKQLSTNTEGDVINQQDEALTGNISEENKQFKRGSSRRRRRSRSWGERLLQGYLRENSCSSELI